MSGRGGHGVWAGFPAQLRGWGCWLGGPGGWQAPPAAELQLGNRLAQTALAGADTRQVVEGLREALELVEGGRWPWIVPVALPLGQFLDLELKPPEPLLGSDGENVISRGGLVVFGGKPGVGKTTLAVDLVFRAAAGRPWLGLPVRRPLKVMMVENERPVQQFQRKLKHKAERWEHPIGGRGACACLAVGVA